MRERIYITVADYCLIEAIKKLNDSGCDGIELGKVDNNWLVSYYKEPVECYQDAMSHSNQDDEFEQKQSKMKEESAGGECMTEYSKFLNHLGIDKNQLLSSMRSKLPDCEKPYQLKRCIHFNSCESGKLGGCRGCNVWNYLYDINVLREWCQKHDKDFMSMTMYMQKQLNEE